MNFCMRQNRKLTLFVLGALIGDTDCLTKLTVAKYMLLHTVNWSKLPTENYSA
jgi:hypothetical protein